MEPSSNLLTHPGKINYKKYRVNIPTKLSLKKNIGGQKFSVNNKRKSMSRKSGCFEYDIFNRPEDTFKKPDDLVRPKVTKVPVPDKINNPDHSNSKKTPNADESVIVLSSDEEAQAGVIDILNKIYGDGWKTPVMLKNPKIKKCISIKQSVDKKKCTKLNLTETFDDFKNNVRDDFESTRRPVVKSVYSDFKKPLNSVETSSDSKSSDSDSICMLDNISPLKIKSNLKTPSSRIRQAAIKVLSDSESDGEIMKGKTSADSSSSDLLVNSDSNKHPALLKIKSKLKTSTSRPRKPTVISSSDSDSDSEIVKREISADSRSSDSDSVCVLDKSPIISKSNFQTPSKRRDSFINDSSSERISSDSDDDSFKNSPAFYNNVDNKVRKNKLLQAMHTGNLKNRLEKRYNVKNDDINDLDNSFAKLNIAKPKFERLPFLESLSDNVDPEKCHLDALKYHKNFKQHREELTQKLFDLYNKNVFKHQLPFDMALIWDKHLRKTAGTCRNMMINKNNQRVRISSIKLSIKVLDRPSRLRNTLIHELCHAAVFVISLTRDGHGSIWKSWTAKAMKIYPVLAPIGVTHSYAIDAKFAYVCENCGYTIKRHSKSLDTKGKVCGKCRGTFIIHRKNKNGGLDLVKSFSQNCNNPNSFPMFVKNNYGKIKAVGLSHGDVMKKLSEMFKNEKLRQ